MEDPVPEEGFMDNFVGWSRPDLGGAMVFLMWASVVLEGCLNCDPVSRFVFLTAELDSLLPTLNPVFLGVNWSVFTAEEADGLCFVGSATPSVLDASGTEEVDVTEDLLDTEGGAKLLRCT